ESIETKVPLAAERQRSVAKAQAPVVRLRSIREVEERILLRRVEVVAIPPAAAQRLEQRHGVGETIGLRLDAHEQRLQVGLLRIEDQERIDIAKFQASARDGEAAVGGV